MLGALRLSSALYWYLLFAAPPAPSADVELFRLRPLEYTSARFDSAAGEAATVSRPAAHKQWHKQSRQRQSALGSRSVAMYTARI